MIPRTREAQRTNKQLWQDRISDWQASELSGQTWCKKKAIKYSKFLYWKSKLVSENPETPFVEIGDDPGCSGIEIEIQDVKIRLSKDFDSNTLKRFFYVMKAELC